MQKLISITKNEFEPLISEDHYIIDIILENLLNEEISDLFLKANNCIEDENFSDALTFYDLILNIDSKNLSALIDKGTTLQVLGQIKSAISYFDKALSISPCNLDALINKGSAFHLEENYLEAISCYESALKIDKKCSMALAYKGLSLGELGKLSEAISYFKKALSIDKYCTLAQISKETAQNLLNSSNLKSKKL
jgi:tetratricopeptide (TPR) repeat protein